MTSFFCGLIITHSVLFLVDTWTTDSPQDVLSFRKSSLVYHGVWARTRIAVTVGEDRGHELEFARAYSWLPGRVFISLTVCLRSFMGISCVYIVQWEAILLVLACAIS